jgi:GGDEF domain-containing protein
MQAQAVQPGTTQPEALVPEQMQEHDALLTLVRGIQKHLEFADNAGSQEFRTELENLERRFQTAGARELAEAAVNILGRYEKQAKESIERQKSSIASAAQELAQATQALPAIQRSAERWNRVEEQIKAIAPGENLEVAKARLCATVAVARAETFEQHHEIEALLSEITGKLDLRAAGSQDAGAQHLPDPLTGLPARAQAENELTRVHGQTEEIYLTLFVVKRLALINAKFGYARGDEVLLKVVVHLVHSLQGFNNLFRWAPCAFLTIAPSHLTYKELRAKIQAIEISRLTPTLEWEGRSAMVPVAIDCRILSAKDFEMPSNLFLRLDALATEI